MAVVVNTKDYDSGHSSGTEDYDIGSDGGSPMAMFLRVEDNNMTTCVSMSPPSNNSQNYGQESSELGMKTKQHNLSPKNNAVVKPEEEILTFSSTKKPAESSPEKCLSVDKDRRKSDFLRIQFKKSSISSSTPIKEKDPYLNSNDPSSKPDESEDVFPLQTTFKQEKPFIMDDDENSFNDSENTTNEYTGDTGEQEFVTDIAAMRDSLSNYQLKRSNERINSTQPENSLLSMGISQDLGDLSQYPSSTNYAINLYKNDTLVDELRKQHSLPASSHSMIAQFLENEVQTALKRGVLNRFVPNQMGDLNLPSTSGVTSSSVGTSQDEESEADKEPGRKVPELVDCPFVVNGKTLRPCSVCGKVFKTTKELRIHFRTHTNEKPFVCDICGKAFRQRAHLGSHEKIHSGEKPFTCELCQTSFTENSSLKRHLRRHFGIKPFRCNVCGENFITSTLLKSHTRRRHEEKRYEYHCNMCPKIYSCKESLNKHKRSHDPETRISCHKCGLVCLTMGHLRRHLRVHERQETMVDTKVKPYECGNCGRTYTMKSHLERHLLSLCGKEPNKCRECDITFPTRYAFRQHRSEAHSQSPNKLKPHKCPMCDMHFRLERSCIAHVAKVHTKSKPFECDVCSKKFSRKSKLSNHRQGHFSRDFKCGICEKTYPSARGLKDHMAKKHLNQEKNAKEAFCELCQKVFCDKTVLKEHKRTQHSEIVERFVCQICGSAFSRKHSLTRHLSVHDENKPRIVVGTCDICGKDFYTKYGLTEHKRIIHAEIKEEDKFTCPGCGKKFIRKHSMKRHIKRTTCKDSVDFLLLNETLGKSATDNDENNGSSNDDDDDDEDDDDEEEEETTNSPIKIKIKITGQNGVMSSRNMSLSNDSDDDTEEDRDESDEDDEDDDEDSTTGFMQEDMPADSVQLSSVFNKSNNNRKKNDEKKSEDAGDSDDGNFKTVSGNSFNDSEDVESDERNIVNKTISEFEDDSKMVTDVSVKDFVGDDGEMSADDSANSFDDDDEDENMEDGV